MPKEVVDHDDPTTPAERLEVKDSVQRKLFMLSGNECAWPDCRQVLVPEEGGWFGQIAHIRAAERNGPRFDKAMTNNQRRGFDNLVLLCGKHHRLIDDPERQHQYSREDLEKIKIRHETRFARALDDLSRDEEQYLDGTTANTVVHCSTLLGLYGDFLDEEQRLGEIERFNRIADHLATATLAARQLLCSVVKANSRIGVAEAARRNGGTKRQVYDLVDELRRLHLAEIDPTPWDELGPDDARERIQTTDGARNNPVFEGIPFWNMHEMGAPVDYDAVIVQLDFSVLD
ncbi:MULTISPECIES: hypothetical protein [Streptomyces]|uniref:HNH endonuclease n=2 Tax=Streptomyces TaxID=1883 RepID=A0ABY9JT25_9ACTN|nr:MULTISPECIES: hypothetical protein [unclassified Streptomyces]WLQ69166.1 hypothetical protein P8A20_36985 [Streptomyces sp. Alt3]WSR53208.1 hypothetical protein OG279_00230 [Streptomyces sp. NBC_01201]